MLHLKDTRLLQAQWNEKHMQRLREVEEEEAAAEFEDLPDDPHEPFPEQALERPMRAVRAPRQNTDATGRTTRDPDGGSPQTPAKRGGRGIDRFRPLNRAFLLCQ